MKPELLPSAAPSAKDFGINGKRRSLKLLQMGFSSSVGMDGAVLSASGSGRKTFSCHGIYNQQGDQELDAMIQSNSRYPMNHNYALQ